MLKYGEVRIGTLQEYRDSEKYSGDTLDTKEGECSIISEGPIVVGNNTLYNVSVHTAPLDCHIYCASHSLTENNIRKSKEEGKDSCLEILFPYLFHKWISEIHREKLGTNCAVGEVVYQGRLHTDPSLLRMDAWKANFMKDERFSYQKEVRIVWLDKRGIGTKEPLILRTPILRDILREIKI